LRTFFAIEIDEAIREDIKKIIQQLRMQRGADKVRWIQPEQLHVTLRFLGEVEAEKLENCAQNVIRNLANTPALKIEYSDIIVFPKRHPHVIALNAKLSEELENLIDAIETAVIDSGFAKETRPPLPHVTLGWLRTKFAPKLDKLGVGLPLSHSVDHVTLFRSDSKGNQSMYTALKRIKLTPTSPFSRGAGEGQDEGV
jgi:2'-5' RNA ligase